MRRAASRGVASECAATRHSTRTGRSRSAGTCESMPRGGRPTACRRASQVTRRWPRAVRGRPARASSRRSAAPAPARASTRPPAGRASLLLAPPVTLAGLVPDDLAAVERAVEHLADRLRRPRRRPALLRPRRRCAVLRSASSRCASGRSPSAHSSKIRRTTAASASLMRRSTCDRWPSGPSTLDVVVAEHPAAGDVAGARLALHRVVGPLPRLLALEFVGERRQRTS